MNGLLYLAFGSDYAKLCAGVLRINRKNTDIPMHVLTNADVSLFQGIPDVTTTFLPSITQHQNRIIKLKMPEYTPFDRTLYVDCDAVIQNSGVEKAFELLDTADFAFNYLMSFDNKIVHIYKRCLKMFGVTPPIDVYNGGIIGFKKGNTGEAFFELWHTMWSAFGRGREMPPLNCAIKKASPCIGRFPAGFFAPESENSSAVIQHNWNMARFRAKFGLPVWTEYKPFDSNPQDFHWTTFE